MDVTATREKTLSVARVDTCLQFINRIEVEPPIQFILAGNFWNCKSTDHLARKCPTPLSAKKTPSSTAGKSQVQASTRITQNRKTVDDDVRLSTMIMMNTKKKCNPLLEKRHLHLLG